jgi:hypothetical protein
LPRSPHLKPPTLSSVTTVISFVRVGTNSKPKRNTRENIRSNITVIVGDFKQHIFVFVHRENELKHMQNTCVIREFACICLNMSTTPRGVPHLPPFWGLGWGRVGGSKVYLFIIYFHL